MTHFENCSIHAKTIQLCAEHISCHHDVFFQYFIFGVFVLFRCTVNNVAAVAVAASVVTFGIFLLLLLKMITLYTNYPRQNQTIHLFEDTWAQSPANDRTIFLSFFSFFSRAYKACRAASRNENVAGRKWIKTKHEKKHHHHRHCRHHQHHYQQQQKEKNREEKSYETHRQWSE